MAMKDYSDEFKADAVALYESTPGATYKSIAADLGINRTPCGMGAAGPGTPRRRPGRRPGRQDSGPDPRDLFRGTSPPPNPASNTWATSPISPSENGEFLYLATVLDCFSRKVVGWSIADHMRTGLVADALRMAARTRGGLDGAVFHSDHGAQYGPGPSPASATSSGSPGRWARSAPAPTTRPAKASTRP